jgi:purine/pyrimidine-nucleoside phosphorylase
MIQSNTYFEEKVKSLGYETAEGKSTVGVMEPGVYEFGTSTHETMIVVEGELKATLPGENEATSYKAGQKFEVPANITFKVEAIGQTSYLCKYK